MNFDPFIIPFSVGATFLFVWLFGKLFGWIYTLPAKDKRKLSKHLLSVGVFKTIGEIIRECLFHVRLFRANALLGFMHASLAFGWFLLIIFGTIESKIHSGQAFNMPYDPIFFRYFAHSPAESASLKALSFLMDLVLMLVLTGVLLAWIKRFRSKLFGMRRTTRQSNVDRIALSFLWLIFPLRFFAESATAAIYGNGNFITNILGNLSQNEAFFKTVEYPAWWAYSFSLFFFFILLPFSRYMHIPAEIILIAFRRAGIGHIKRFSSFADIEVESCSRCGVCIDTCQLQKDANIPEVLPVYFLRKVRERKTDEIAISKCMVCGKCAQVCPVHIDVNNQRIAQREDINSNRNFQPLHFEKQSYNFGGKIGYYAGCMTHLTPKIHLAMEKILIQTKSDYVFLDKDGSLCCGRPMLLTGDYNAAAAITMRNLKMFTESGVDQLIVSCPICLKMFKEEYNLCIPVIHHSEFLLNAAREKKIKIHKSKLRITYHDPCELGRGLGIYKQPRELIKLAGNLQEAGKTAKDAPCCGGSLGALSLSYKERKNVTQVAIANYTSVGADILAVSCPLCKKTFASESKNIQIKDIAEIIAENLE